MSRLDAVRQRVEDARTDTPDSPREVEEDRGFLLALVDAMADALQRVDADTKDGSARLCTETAVAVQRALERLGAP